MDAAAVGGLAGVFREYGGWALSVLLTGAVIFLFKRLTDCFEARIADAKALAPLMVEGAAAAREVTVALASRTGIFEQLHGTVAAGNLQAVASAAEVRSDLKDLSRRIDDLARLRERLG